MNTRALQPIQVAIRRFPHLLLPAVVMALLIGLSGSALAKQKVIADFLMPTGIIWLLLLSALCLPGLKRPARGMLLAIWLTYTLTGNRWIGTSLINSLEGPYHQHANPTEPFDAILVLGGGTQLGPDRRPVINASGDRIMEAARLYHRDLTKLLITSGQSIDGSRSSSLETEQIWTDLNIPKRAILRLNNPRNTSEEISALGDLVKTKQWKRVGILTSAWHLRRAMKLGNQSGLNLVPIPSDYLGDMVTFDTRGVIPSYPGFRKTHHACWEYLGAFVGR